MDVNWPSKLILNYLEKGSESFSGLKVIFIYNYPKVYQSYHETPLGHPGGALGGDFCFCHFLTFWNFETSVEAVGHKKWSQKLVLTYMMSFLILFWISVFKLWILDLYEKIIFWTWKSHFLPKTMDEVKNMTILDHFSKVQVQTMFLRPFPGGCFSVASMTSELWRFFGQAYSYLRHLEAS